LPEYSKWFSGQSGSGKKPEAQQSTLKLQPEERSAQKENKPVIDKDEDGDVEMMEDKPIEEEDDVEEDAPRSRKRRRTNPADAKLSSESKAGKHPKPKTEEGLEMEDEDEAPVKSTKKVKVEAIKANEPKATAAAKVEEPLDDDEEKPEEAAKAREQILLVLKGFGKDPYPDWKAGDPTPYAALCTTFHKIEMTTKRLEILAYCSLFLRQVLRLTPDDLLETVLLMINKLGADYTGVELGIGESLIMKAIGESTGRSLNVIKADQNEIGDLGLVAAKSRSKQPTMFKPKPLTIKGVFKGLKDIATIEGQGSQGRKVDGIKKLLSAADAANAGAKVDITQDKGGPSEAKYIVRTLEGKLRLGLADKSVLVALAQAIVFHRTEIVATQNEKNVKPPSEEDVAKGETIMKSVYR
jgi:DNA ligase 1